jgi:hypothetical protein
MLAAFNGDIAAAQALLNRGADVNARDKNGMTALMWTAPEVAPLLLQSNADVRVRDRFGRTALSFAAHLGDAASVQALLDRNLDANDRDNLGRTPLLYAIEGATRVAFEGRASHEFEIVLFHSRARMRGDGKFPGGGLPGRCPAPASARGGCQRA